MKQANITYPIILVATLLLISLFTGKEALGQQDTIITKQGEVILGKIVQVTDHTISYRITSDNGVVKYYSIPFDVVSHLGYQGMAIPDSKHNLYIGAGVGPNYGSLGMNVSWYPVNKLSTFISYGYNFGMANYNLGFTYRVIHNNGKSKFLPLATAMYGTNARVYSETIMSEKLFTGVTLGLGIEYHRKLARKRHWTFLLLLPFRNNERIDDFLKERHVKDDEWLYRSHSWFNVSIGYNFMIL